MKLKIFLTIILFSSVFSTYSQVANDISVGFKFGEPMGINIRKYYKNGDKAIDFNVGTYGFLWDKTQKYRKGQYDGAGISFQLNDIINRHIFSAKNFYAYLGYGAQVNLRKYYQKNDVTGSYDRNSGVSNLSIGADGLAGLQYNLKDKLYLFLEGGIYAELLPSPFFLFPQANTGFRIHINK